MTAMYKFMNILSKINVTNLYLSLTSEVGLRFTICLCLSILWTAMSIEDRFNLICVKLSRIAFAFAFVLLAELLLGGVFSSVLLGSENRRRWQLVSRIRRLESSRSSNSEATFWCLLFRCWQRNIFPRNSRKTWNKTRPKIPSTISEANVGRCPTRMQSLCHTFSQEQQTVYIHETYLLCPLWHGEFLVASLHHIYNKSRKTQRHDDQTDVKCIVETCGRKNFVFSNFTFAGDVSE